MKPEKPKKLGFRKIYYNLDKILFLFFLIFMMVEFVWLPLNSWIAGILLRQTGYLFVPTITLGDYTRLAFYQFSLSHSNCNQSPGRLFPDLSFVYRGEAPSLP